MDHAKADTNVYTQVIDGALRTAVDKSNPNCSQSGKRGELNRGTRCPHLLLRSQCHLERQAEISEIVYLDPPFRGDAEDSRRGWASSARFPT